MKEVETEHYSYLSQLNSDYKNRLREGWELLDRLHVISSQHSGEEFYQTYIRDGAKEDEILN